MLLTYLYQINGKPMPVPDEGVEMSFEDLDSAQSGRDESGFMHRIVVRSKVGVWNFTYSWLDEETYRYLLSILPEEGVFTFTYPDQKQDGAAKTTAYLSRYGISWHNARTNTYRNLKFSIIEC